MFTSWWMMDFLQVRVMPDNPQTIAAGNPITDNSCPLTYEQSSIPSQVIHKRFIFLLNKSYSVCACYSL